MRNKHLLKHVRLVLLFNYNLHDIFRKLQLIERKISSEAENKVVCNKNVNSVIICHEQSFIKHSSVSGLII